MVSIWKVKIQKVFMLPANLKMQVQNPKGEKGDDKAGK